MWISRYEYNRIIERLEALEKGPLYEYCYTDFVPWRVPMSSVIRKIVEHLGLTVGYKRCEPSDIVLKVRTDSATGKAE